MLLKSMLIRKAPSVVKLGMVFMCLVVLSACFKSTKPKVFNLGLKGDSKTGAMIVNKGDTLWKISKRYRLPLRNIIDLNKLKPPYTLNKGQRLKLPPPLEYKVRKRDSLHRVSRMFDVSVYQLVRLNNLQQPYNLKIGQNLRIPSRRSSYSGAEKVSTKVASKQSPLKKVSVKHVGAVPTKRPVAVKVSGAKKPRFIWPVKGKVLSTYGPKKSGQYNDGVNIAAKRSARIVAAADGVVAYVGDDLESYGNLVLIRHGGGMTTAYAHLSKIRVKKGERVKRMQIVGHAGSTGNVKTSQLHFEIRKGSKTYNPLRYL